MRDERTERPVPAQDLVSLARKLGGEVSGGQVKAPGPGHSPDDRSMSVMLAPDAEGGFIVNSFSPKDDFITCRDHIRSRLGLPPWKPNGRGTSQRREAKPKPKAKLGKIIATYDYTDVDGNLLYQVVRLDPKDFRQRRRPRPDDPPKDIKDDWVWNLKGIVHPTLYYLPDVCRGIKETPREEQKTWFLAEGERDVEALLERAFYATTNSEGADKFRPELAEHFRDAADVVLLEDNDEAGAKRAKTVPPLLFNVGARVRVLRIADHEPKGAKDIAEWFDKGGTHAKLNAILDKLPDWEPPPATDQPPDSDGVFDPEAPPPGETGDPADDLIALNEIDAGDDPGPIPPRGWLLANQFCRQFLSSLVATGGTGKTALRMLQYISLAIGRSLTGEHVFRRCRVLVLGFDDDITELHRRLLAALIHHRIDRAELKGWLFIAAPKGLKLAEMRKGGRQAGKLERTLRDAIARRKPDIIGLDPFVKLHALEENDNGAMDFVCDLLTQLAIERDIAVDAPHHARKGSATPGDADIGRGASGIKDAGRLVHTLTTMSVDEAKMFNICEVDRNSYIRLDPAKVNITPRSQQAKWFKLVGVRLGNGTDQYPNGDEVQTVEPWSPPDTWADTSTPVLNTILNEIDAGLPNGQRYSDAPRAGDRAAWKVVQRHYPDKSEPQCREIIKTWVGNGVLRSEPYHDPGRRAEVNGLQVNASKRPGTAC